MSGRKLRSKSQRRRRKARKAARKRGRWWLASHQAEMGAIMAAAFAIAVPAAVVRADWGIPL
jgi:hypothetical protein